MSPNWFKISRRSSTRKLKRPFVTFPNVKIRRISKSQSVAAAIPKKEKPVSHKGLKTVEPNSVRRCRTPFYTSFLRRITASDEIQHGGRRHLEISLKSQISNQPKCFIDEYRTHYKALYKCPVQSILYEIIWRPNASHQTVLLLYIY